MGLTGLLLASLFSDVGFAAAGAATVVFPEPAGVVFPAPCAADVAAAVCVAGAKVPVEPSVEE